jgi:hypothetical protein
MTSLLEKFGVGDKVTGPNPLWHRCTKCSTGKNFGHSAQHVHLWARAARQASEGGDSGFVTRILAIHEWLALAGPRGGWVPRVSGDGLRRGRV